MEPFQFLTPPKQHERGIGPEGQWVVGISVSGGPSIVGVTDLAAELGVHSGSPPAVLGSH
jgi:hypothetical protein